MTKLTDTQRIILSAASQRTDRLALPLPKSLKGGAAHKVINSLIDKGLLKEVKANRKLNDPVDTPRVQAPDGGLIEIELAGGRRVRLSGPVDVQALKRVIAFLEGR